MNRSTLAAKLLAASLVLPLVLTGCGSKDKDKDKDVQTTTSSSSAAASAAASAVEATKEKKDQNQETTSAEKSTTAAPLPTPTDPQVQEALQQLEKAMKDGTVDGVSLSTVAKVTDGQPASPEDKAALTDLVSRTLWAPDLRQLMSIYVDVVCKRAMDPVGGPGAVDLNAVPDMPLDPALKPSIDKVENVVVKGDEASADFTITNQGQTTTVTKSFLKEDGVWKICG